VSYILSLLLQGPIEQESAPPTVDEDDLLPPASREDLDEYLDMLYQVGRRGEEGAGQQRVGEERRGQDKRGQKRRGEERGFRQLRFAALLITVFSQ
jgi:hypothetical protein